MKWDSLKHNPNVVILLATCNGEKYIKEQLDSLFTQTYGNWTLYIHDDGSSDKTLEIINKYCNNHDNIHILTDNKRKGAKNSFIWLLEQVNADYYMFCDQDDVWLPFKIEKVLEKMLLLEKLNPNKAVLVNTDLIVVDNNLDIIALSFWKYSKINPKLLQNFEYLSVCNFITGCTMMINNKVKNLSLPIARDAIMHDAWIALNVANNGIIDYIDIPTVLYRQHTANVVGAKGIHNIFSYFVGKISMMKEVVRQNKDQWKMVNTVRPFSFMKYIKFKILYFFQR
jgi:glycosyltransferase involved in cell wall biosynthesis